MARLKTIKLVGGAYMSDDIIADLQRCCNLYPETNQSEEAPAPVTHYLTAGLTQVGVAPAASGFRCLYTATNGDVYCVVGLNVYFIAVDWSFTFLGSIADLTTPAYMADNGIQVCLVDGTTSGYSIDMTTRAMTAIVDPSFYGSIRVDYIDSFFVFCKPHTRIFYISRSNSLTFDPLDFVAKSGSPDNIETVICTRREAWLMGSISIEPWYDAGQADFALSPIPGAYLEQGTCSPHSVAKLGENIFWVQQDKVGNGSVAMRQGYAATKISTFAIDKEIQAYLVLNDAVGFCYQLGGHAFYQLTFPNADVTWVFDIATQSWHRRASIDQNGVLHRHRAQVGCVAYGETIVGDFQNGILYIQDPANFTDNGVPIPRIRTFPHITAKGQMIEHQYLALDMQVGQLSSDSTEQSLISLRWSDTKGQNWGNDVVQTMSLAGEYLTQIIWNDLGQARDRVYELSWSTPVVTALNGGYVSAMAVE